jgi:hypothetical protein
MTHPESESHGTKQLAVLVRSEREEQFTRVEGARMQVAMERLRNGLVLK